MTVWARALSAQTRLVSSSSCKARKRSVCIAAAVDPFGHFFGPMKANENFAGRADHLLLVFSTLWEGTLAALSRAGDRGAVVSDSSSKISVVRISYGLVSIASYKEGD